MTDSANIALKPEAFKLPAYTENARLRLATGTLLYFAQGLAQGLFFIAIPSWLAANGQSAGVVGSFIAAVSLPWSLKVLIGGLVDRYGFLPMGRRRAWLIAAQTCLIISLAAFALRSPLPSELTTIIIFGTILSTMTAVQDVALDAMIIDLTPKTELGQINGFMLGGKVFGIAGGGALAAYFMEFHSFATAMFVVACLFSIPAFFAILVRERKGERLFPWTDGAASQESIEIKPDAWWPVLRETFKGVLLRRDPLLIIGLCIFYGMHQGIFEATLPVYVVQELGWGETGYASLSGIGGLVAGGAGIFVGGWLTDKLGPAKVALWSAGLAAIGLAGFVALGLNFGSDLVFSAWYLLVAVIVLGFYLSMITLGMRVCERHVAATSYALMMGSMALGLMLGAGSVGFLDQIGGYTALLTAAIVTILVSAGMSLGLSPSTGGPAASEPEHKQLDKQEHKTRQRS
ncbi:MAG: MFS transporter [Pseudomonadota bacterium]